MGRPRAAPLVFAPTDEERKVFETYLELERNPKIIVPPSREKIHTPKDIFSPQSFEDYIGQSEAKQLAQIMVAAAHNERRRLPSIMVVGEYGLGKTSLARIIMRAAGLSERLYDGASINKEFPEPGTFIIDEIHNLETQVADTLNTRIDNGSYTIIGCTNNPGALPSAFRSRFRTLQLHAYTPDDLRIVVRRICERKGIRYTERALNLLAERSRFNARQVIMYLSLVFDIMSVNKTSALNVEVVHEAFSHLGVDSNGLLPRDREYLRVLPNRPVGLQFLSAVLGIDEKTIEEEVEPFLLRMGLIDRTPRGRVKIES